MNEIDIKICTKNIIELGNQRKKIFTYIPDKNCLKDNLSVNENLKNWLKLSDVTVNNQNYQKALSTFSLYNIQESLVKNLSHGQKKKVALTKLLFSKSKLWLLDEPLSYLDENGAKLVLKLLNNHLIGGGIIIASSHIDFSANIDNSKVFYMDNSL